MRDRLARAGCAGFVALWALAAMPGSASAQKLFNDDRSFDKSHALKFASAISPLGVMTRAMFFDAAAPSPSGARRPASVKEPACGCEFKEDGSLLEPTRCEAMRGVADESKAVVSTIVLMPIEDVVSHMMCFRSGLKACESGGVTVGGISCCLAQERGVPSAARDPNFHLVAPLVLVEKLAGMKPGRAAAGSPTMCGFSYDSAAGVFSVPERFDGLLARMYIYANQRYGAQTPATLDVLKKISETRPPTAFELARERYIRFQYRAPSDVMQPYVRATRPSYGLQSLGIRD